MKKLFILITLCLTVNLFATTITSDACNEKGEEYIFAGGECINYAIFEGDDNEKLMIIVHGTWDEGTNTLGRYAPFAETLNLNTDVTTIAVALPGYSKSSLNNLKSIGSKKYNHQASTKAYVVFLGDLVEALKKRYESKNVTLVGHSAGAMMAISLSGLRPDLLNNLVSVGGRYSIPNRDKTKTLVAEDVIDTMSKQTKFLLIYGTADKISKPEVTIKFYEQAMKKNLNVTLVKVEGAGHIDLDMTDTSVEAITELLEE